MYLAHRLLCFEFAGHALFSLVFFWQNKHFLQSTGCWTLIHFGLIPRYLAYSSTRASLKMWLTIFPYENNIAETRTKEDNTSIHTSKQKVSIQILARLIRALMFGIVLYEWLINATKFTIVRSKCFNYYENFNFFVIIIVSFPSYWKRTTYFAGGLIEANFKAVYRPYDENWEWSYSRSESSCLYL